MDAKTQAALDQARAAHPSGHHYKWWYCLGCHRIYKDNRKNLIRHMGHGRQRIAGDESWTHGFYQPELWWDAIRLKLERWFA